MQLQTEWVEKSLNLNHQLSNQVITKITTDSRQISPGSLFVAIKGEKFDGHDFIDDAFKNGAIAALCRKSFSPENSENEARCYKVEDPEKTFRVLAGHYRRHLKTPLILIAGSNGKTTTKELLFSILKGKYSHVHKTQGSQNGFLGIPITLFELTEKDQIGIIEVGIDEPGAMIQHLNLVDPDASIVTSIGPEHLEKFINIETIAKEECLSLSFSAAKTASYFLDNKPFIIIQNDDPWVSKETKHLSSKSAKIINSTLKVHHVDLNQNLLHFKSSEHSFDLPLPLPGIHNVQNLLLATHAALACGLTPQEIQNGLKQFAPAFGRSDLKKHKNGYLLYCDYYNANPASMRAGLQSLKDISYSGNLILCLGDMLELGIDEIKLHEDLSNEISGLKTKEVLLFGNRMLSLHQKLNSLSIQSKHFDTQQGLGEHLKAIVKPCDLVFIKGSRGMKMEKVVESL